MLLQSATRNIRSSSDFLLKISDRGNDGQPGRQSAHTCPGGVNRGLERGERIVEIEKAADPLCADSRVRRDHFPRYPAAYADNECGDLLPVGDDRQISP